MAKKSKTLQLLLYSFPVSALGTILNTMVVVWVGKPEKIAAWITMLPLVTAIIGLLGTAAAGGPLVADNIKAKAGALNAPEQ